MHEYRTMIRTAKDRNHPYVLISRDVFNDTRLSWEARGLLGYLLSKPDNWEIRFGDLLRRGPGGRDRMRRMMQELAETGYLQRGRFNNDQGLWEWVAVVYETPPDPALALAAPAAENPGPSPEKASMVPENPGPSTGLPSTVQPSTVQPSTANPSIYRIETLPNTDSLNREGEGDAAPAATAPALHAVATFTPDAELLAWLRGEVESAGLPASAVAVAPELARWRDDIVRGARRYPADLAADWRHWMRLAIRWALAHREESPHAQAGTDRRHPEPPLTAAEAERNRAALAAAIADALPGARRPAE